MSLDDFDSRPEYGRSRSEKKSNVGKILLIIFGIIGFTTLLCCGGCYFIVNSGLQMIATGVKNDLNANQAVTEKTGQITECSTRFWESAQQTGANNNGNIQVFVFDFTGTQASGTFTADMIQNPDGTYTIIDGEVVLDNGETIQVE